MSDLQKARSQTSYLFTYKGTTISWQSMKQTMIATSSNHAEILVIHEASREGMWLRSVIWHIQKSCGLTHNQHQPTTLHEDNAACITHIKYIKGDTKSISHQNFSSLISFKRMVKFTFNKFVKILQICSLRLYHRQLSSHMFKNV